MGYKILIADDEAEIRDLLHLYLEKDGYEVIEAADGAQALSALQDAALRNESIDLVILDIMMPGIDGYRVLRNIRENSNIPVIMLSAKSGDEDKILGLDLGADDYMTKPFSLAVLRARIKALVRRGQAQKESVYAEEPFRFDFGGLVFAKDGREIALSVNEQRLLRLLVENRGRVLPGVRWWTGCGATEESM